MPDRSAVKRWFLPVLATLVILVAAGILLSHGMLTKEGIFGDTRASLMEGRVVTESVKVENRNDKKLEHTAYLLKDPLAPRARLLKVRPWRGYLWFSGDTGLLRFDPENGEWMVYDRDNGLPADTAYDLAIDPDGGLLVEAYDWIGEHSIGSRGRYWLDTEGFQSADKTLGEAVAGEAVTENDLGLYLPRYESAIRFDGYVWLGSLGKHEPEKDRFTGGGVYRIDPDARKAKFWGGKDGLARSYSYELVFDKKGDLWVSHWDEERGLSRFSPETGEWEVVEQSQNGIELGGIDLAAVGEYLLIGQQRGLVVYEVDTGRAVSIDEDDGLPGYIVTDVMVQGDDVWVTANSREGTNRNKTGLINVQYEDIEALF